MESNQIPDVLSEVANAEGAEAAAAWRAVSSADTGPESGADAQPTAAAVTTAELFLIKYPLSDQTSSQGATERPASEYVIDSCPCHIW